VTTTETKTPEIPQPTFPHHAYGVDLDWLGDEGGMVARGHIPELRFVAACNHLARTEARLVNIWDDRTAVLEETLVMVGQRWALPIDPSNLGTEWAIDLASQVTGQTPGAIPVTTLLPLP
jgi:hypothetical protein